MEFKSTIKKIKDVDWTHTLILDDLVVDQNALNMHKQRIDAVYKSKTEEERAMQLHNIIVRENLFNKAMDYLTQFYEINLQQDEVDALAPKLKVFLGEDAPADRLNAVAQKVIFKSLVFDDIQKEFKIEITDEELNEILENYYSETNLSIRDFKENKEQWNAAKKTLLDEKTTAFIIDKFPRDLNLLEKKLRERLAEQMELDKKIEEIKNKPKPKEEKPN